MLQGLQGKGYLESQVVIEIEDVIKERETNADDLGLDAGSPHGDTEMADAPPSPSQSQSRNSKKGPSGRLDKRQIEQRIEEDRERHKRERESIWAIPKETDAEMNKLWEETSDFGEDDDRLIAEEADNFTTEMDMQKCSHQKATNGTRH